ncbi:parapinopsin-like [Synchiropus splendidus]|uniref:parapinopsin-like n=1 Tax=Synchiropus splendidus TaxID=270530 RepID=UPI00237DB9CA|nr:parapinopsin-like [Synchiropus splendidus]
MDSNSSTWSSSLTVPAESLTVVPTIFPRIGYSILSFLMFISTVFTVFNNGLVITVMLKNPTILQPMNVFILSLAVSDLMIGLCGSLVVTITNYKGSFFIGHAACVFQGFAVNYFGLVSLCTLTLLAYERYRVVCTPKACFKLSMRRSLTALAFIWSYCLFWAVAPLLGWSGYGPEGVQTSCSLSWEERSWSNYSYLITYMTLCFILPVTVIIFCYIKVLKSMSKLNSSVESQGGRSSQKENDRAIIMVLSMLAAFFICWLPYTILSVVVVVDPDTHIPPLLATMPMYFAKTSPIYNPIIYFLANKQFRDAALEVLSCGRYIPRGPTVQVPMRPTNRRSQLLSLSKNFSTHAKVLPL